MVCAETDRDNRVRQADFAKQYFADKAIQVAAFVL